MLSELAKPSRSQSCKLNNWSLASDLENKLFCFIPHPQHGEQGERFSWQHWPWGLTECSSFFHDSQPWSVDSKRLEMGQRNRCWMRVRYKAEFSLDLMLLKYHRWFLLGFGLMWQDWSRVSCSARSSLEFSWAWGVEWDFSHTWSTRLSLSCLGVNLGAEMAGPWSVHRNQSGLVWTQVLVFFSLTGICTSELWQGLGCLGVDPFPC